MRQRRWCTMDYKLYSRPPHPDILHPLACNPFSPLVRCRLALTLSNFTAHIARQVLDLVGTSGPPHPMDSITNETFGKFIASTIAVSETKISVVLVASLYLQRCKRKFNVTAFGQLWLKERVFIAAIVLANKVSRINWRRVVGGLPWLSVHGR